MSNDVIVLVPAHNEGAIIGDTLRSLLTQTRPPDRVVVISDNSTDDTVSIASSFGPVVECYETVGNTDKKSGALNQMLDRLDVPDDTFILIVDADTILNPVWIEVALRAFDDPKVGAVGGIFIGDEKNGLLGYLQSLEYARYKREIRRDYGKARVLTGTSTMTRIGTFREVKRLREQRVFPGRGYYNVEAITEDNEMTICIKRLGYKTISPKECTVVTETMPTIPMLWKQRTRWTIGAFDTITQHGLNRVTTPYALRQVEAGIGIFANISIIALAVWAVMTGQFVLAPFWMAIGLWFQIERVMSAKEYGWKGVAIAATIVMDLVFDLFISAVWIWCVVKKATTRKRDWGSVSIDTVGA